jgi:hypothetical protein
VAGCSVNVLSIAYRHSVLTERVTLVPGIGDSVIQVDTLTEEFGLVTAAEPVQERGGRYQKRAVSPAF